MAIAYTLLAVIAGAMLPAQAAINARLGRCRARPASDRCLAAAVLLLAGAALMR